MAKVETDDVGLLSDLNFDVIEKMSLRPDLLAVSVIGYFDPAMILHHQFLCHEN
ncbi:TPA: hypothetical protein MAM02_004577 [Klebsiella pneumoniae]|nr:hypothetical protein [Klebsiella pneumoniae]